MIHSNCRSAMLKIVTILEISLFVNLLYQHSVNLLSLIGQCKYPGGNIYHWIPKQAMQFLQCLVTAEIAQVRRNSKCKFTLHRQIQRMLQFQFTNGMSKGRWFLSDLIIKLSSGILFQCLFSDFDFGLMTFSKQSGKPRDYLIFVLTTFNTSGSQNMSWI
jgi:hypothetical protein